MALLPQLFIVIMAFEGFTEGVGVLPDGPLIAAVGETVKFNTTLTPTGPPFPTATWILNDSIIIISSTNINDNGPEYEGRVTLFPSTGSLELRNLVLDDSGAYSVTIVPGGAGRTMLVMYEKVSSVLVTSSSTDLVEFSGSVSLSCSASGSSLSFLWFNGSSEVTASDRVQLTDGGSSLTIINVTRSDQGPFKCRVSNPVSTSTSDPVNLSISYGPENIHLILSPSQEYFAVGSDISLTCSVESRPLAQFKWFLNGDQLPDSGSELRLMNVQMSQSGNYSCQAFNSKTLRSQTSHPSAITVLEPSSGLSAGAIAGIVIACFVLVAAAAGGGYFFYKKKGPLKKSTNRDTSTTTGGNAASSSQELNYADVSFFPKRNDGRVQMGLQNESSNHAQVQANNRAPAASSLPTYDTHVHQVRRPAPQADPNAAETYAQVRVR
ncbi:carcinoembryonic antigen-related cell adhesion molecule 6-like isoform X2 [Oreochromis niloticus]|uniref:carcinoembryonic antigen-related cell adhesion molecule 6-like isoform X2 n=1 Tax=Oreochromis niloticus TaxID=8128 RepID=UPI0009059B7C|nr:carcinoembryonic antigen-related cell adhesion molecule 6-like isoform X2 [Oreochromis niloticus]